VQTINQNFMKEFFMVGLGGLIGSMGRYGLSIWIKSPTTGWPTATFSANLIGSLLIGVLLASSVKNNDLLRLLVVTGFCGGFTTFSTFSLESLRLWQNGEHALFVGYVLASLFGGMLLAYFGFLLGDKYLGSL
jgi:CrcB protein